ncbi:MAG: hypothetical protein AAB214_06595, partial [Fibrobacterota bacterium]
MQTNSIAQLVPLMKALEMVLFGVLALLLDVPVVFRLPDLNVADALDRDVRERNRSGAAGMREIAC